MAIWWRKLIARLTPRRRVEMHAGDQPPSILPRRNLVLVRDGGEEWSVGLRCPCGCGTTLEMMLLRGVRPRWDLSIDAKGHPTLRPSVWLKSGCRSHFWLRDGRIVWAGD